MEQYKIARFSPPGKYDQHPKGTQCIVMLNPESPCYTYTQISKNEENPVWSLTETQEYIPEKRINDQI